MDYYLNFVQEVESGQISPVYLFHGEETFLHQRAVECLRANLIVPGTEDFNYTLVDGEEASVNEIVALARQAPVLAVSRLVVVKNAPYFLKNTPSQVHQTLESYLKSPSSSTCLVFLYSGVLPTSQKLINTISTLGKTINFMPLPRKAVARWLNREAKKAGKVFTQEAMDRLFASQPGGLQNMAVELEKLLLLVGEDARITEKDVAAVTVPSQVGTVFQVVDAVGNLDFEAALASIKQLLAVGETPGRILGMLNWHFRLMLQVKELNGDGFSELQIAKRLQSKSFVIRKTLGQSTNFTRQTLVQGLVNLLEVDEAVKIGKKDFLPAVSDFLIILANQQKQPR